MVKPRMRWTGHVVCMWRWEMHIGIWLEIQKDGIHCKDLDVGFRIILKFILEFCGVDCIDLVQDLEPVQGCC
jgi:hypothetical protein